MNDDANLEDRIRTAEEQGDLRQTLNLVLYGGGTDLCSEVQKAREPGYYFVRDKPCGEWLAWRVDEWTGFFWLMFGSDGEIAGDPDEIGPRVELPTTP